MQAAGWIIPMSWLISNERVRDYGCDSVRAAAEYFQKGCAPGIRDRDYMLSRWGSTQHNEIFFFIYLQKIFLF